MLRKLALLALLAVGASAANDTNACGSCDTTKVWNDVYVLVDGSTGLSDEKFSELTDFILGSFAMFSIGQNPQNTRVALSVYSDRLVNLATLNNFTSVDDLLSVDIAQLNQEGTDVKSAIDNAREHFNTNQHRANARKVILIAASTFRQGSYEDPVVSAQTFKDNGGIIIVLEFGDSKGIVDPMLRKIASPGYYVDATDHDPDMNAFAALQCSANCFCPPLYTTMSTSPDGQPNAGCFFVSSLPSIKLLADNHCKKDHGHLAYPIEKQQQIFILASLKQNPVWVGLTKTSTSDWTWQDGTPMTWPVKQTGTGNCGYLQAGTGFGTVFVESDCHQAYQYACQTTPCSSTNYCN